MSIDIFTGWLEYSGGIMNLLARTGLPKGSVLPLKIESCNGFSIYISRTPVDLLDFNYGTNCQQSRPLKVFN
jgi:hypothetical protein